MIYPTTKATNYGRPSRTEVLANLGNAIHAQNAQQLHLQDAIQNLQPTSNVSLIHGHTTLTKFGDKPNANFSEWIDTFDRICIAEHNIDDNRKAQILPLLLSGNALEVYRDLDEDTKNNYQLAVTALKTSLQPAELARVKSVIRCATGKRVKVAP